MSLHKPAAQGKTAFSVREYGAVGDGKSLDTAAINKAVEACASAGGGQVLLPPGKYLSGTVRLRSNVTLVIDAGAMLIGSTNLEHYQSLTLPHPQAGTRPPGAPPSNWHRALILGDGVENVAVLGHGTIDGNKVFDPRGEEKMRGPHTIVFGKSRRVTIRDVSIRDSANYAILLERDRPGRRPRRQGHRRLGRRPLPPQPRRDHHRAASSSPATTPSPADSGRTCWSPTACSIPPATACA